ncbi:MAG: flagellar basal body P-ring protein FlgI [Lentisphaeraceae bacterium]|nr:flagellar basal body P-ring protein FlgI [Lentisphaeraceae bacterium]
MRNFLILLFILVGFSLHAQKKSKTIVRIKDTSRILGQEEYFVTGFGIVVGLGGTGDSDSELTQHTLKNLLTHFKLQLTEEQLRVQNCAAVKITATVRSGSFSGDMLSCTVATIGDASSLLGGELIMSPILGADGELWGIAQGGLTVGGGVFGEAGAGGDSIVKNIPTVGRLVGGLKLKRDVGNLDYLNQDQLTFLLNHHDFTSAKNMTASINEKFTGAAVADGENRIRVKVPNSYFQQNKVVNFISEIGQLTYETDKEAKIIFNERTGTIIVGGEVKISAVAVSHGNIVVRVKNTLNVSQAQPDAFGGATVVTPDSSTDFQEDNSKLQYIPEITNVQQLVESLNKLGVSPRDMMSIFHILKDSGALHARLVTQ